MQDVNLLGPHSRGVADLRSLLEVVFRQEHVEKASLPCLGLQVLHYRRVSYPSLFPLAQLRGIDSVGGYALLFDEFLNLR